VRVRLRRHEWLLAFQRAGILRFDRHHTERRSQPTESGKERAGHGKREGNHRVEPAHHEVPGLQIRADLQEHECTRRLRVRQVPGLRPREEDFRRLRVLAYKLPNKGFSYEPTRHTLPAGMTRL